MFKKIQNPILKDMCEWALVVAIALFVFLLVDNFVMRSARVFGTSMEGTFFDGDRILINRLAFTFREPAFGDIVAFPYAANPTQSYIKRVVGVPGDVVDIRWGQVFINGNALDDGRFLGLGNVLPGNVGFPQTIADDFFFVLGDNLRISEDSRFASVGNVHRDDIIGRVGFRWFPLNSFGRVR